METYLTPFWSRNVVDATRNLSVAVSDPQSNLNRFAEEYSLYKLCELNDETGEIISTKPEKICQLSVLKKPIPYPNQNHNQDERTKI